MKFFILAISCVLWAQTTSYLPPTMNWSGKSEQLIVPSSNPWVTPAELSGFVTTPNYDLTVSWLKNLCKSSPLLKMEIIGSSLNNRPIWMIIASTDKTLTAASAIHSTKPVFLAQAGIHSGEIDGKDAGMMLLRDIAHGKKKNLLKNTHFLFIPILSVDGHERSSKFNRVNQRGPENMGWRTNSKNLNLNRDYSKLDTPELKSVMKIINTWGVDLYYDIHVTDGIDYQYDITYGMNGKVGYSKAITKWMNSVMIPSTNKALKANGHIPGPLIFAMDNKNVERGISNWTAGPRFSNGLGDLRHLPTILVENHSLKPYKQRVLGTYILLEQTLKTLNINSSDFLKSIAKDRQYRASFIPLSFKPSAKMDTLNFLGIENAKFHSPASGSNEVRWLGKPIEFSMPYLGFEPANQVARPKGYWIPAAWTDVISRLKAHGIKMDIIQKEKAVDVSIDEIKSFKFSKSPFEGRMRVSIKEVASKKTQRLYAPGSAWVSTDQPLGDLAIILLEPKSADSFIQWGFFNTIFQRTEYIEGYAIAPMAEQMLKDDPQLKKEFEAKLAEDEKFKSSPRARLGWFYKQTPYYDQEYLLYPVGRVG